MPVVRVPLVPLNQSSTLAISTGNTERLTRLVLIGFSSNAKTTAPLSLVAGVAGQDQRPLTSADDRLRPRRHAQAPRNVDLHPTQLDKPEQRTWLRVGNAGCLEVLAEGAPRTPSPR